MAVLGFNPAAEMSMLRTQQTLAMQASAPAAGAAPAAAAEPAAAAAAQGAAAPGAAADASVGAAAVQPPPSTSSIVLRSVLTGALSGASLTLGVKQFGPMLAKIGFIGKAIGTVAPPAGILGFSLSSEALAIARFCSGSRTVVGRDGYRGECRECDARHASGQRFQTPLAIGCGRGDWLGRRLDFSTHASVGST